MEHDPATEGAPGGFEKTCSYCGARFRVLASQGRGLVHSEEYDCPECGKSYRMQAAAEPDVHLLQPRRDGKSDRYQETMF